MKRKRIIAVLILPALLSGCTLDDVKGKFMDYIMDEITEKGMEKSGIYESEDYENYQEHLDSGDLDIDGKYKADEINLAVQAMASVSDKITITSATNSKLSVSYFEDAEMTKKIDDINNYPCTNGTIIYVSAEPLSDNDPLFVFSKIKVWDIDSESGNKLREMNDVWDSSISAIRIPDDYSGTDIALEPIGEYLSSTATLEAYITKSDGTKQPVDVTWTVDGVRYTSSTVQLDSAQSHSISVKFDDGNYYYPDNSFSKLTGCTASKNTLGNDEVEFNDIVFTETNSKFSAELCKYITCTVDDTGLFSHINSLKLNGEEIDEKTVSKLKKGDKITVDTDKGYTAYCDKISNPTTESVSNGTRFTFVVPKTDEDIKIKIYKASETVQYEAISFPNAVCEARLGGTGELLKSGDKVNGNDKMTLTITPNEGYYISGPNVSNNIYENTMKCVDYVKSRNDIIKKIEITNTPPEEKNLFEKFKSLFN